MFAASSARRSRASRSATAFSASRRPWTPPLRRSILRCPAGPPAPARPGRHPAPPPLSLRSRTRDWSPPAAGRARAGSGGGRGARSSDARPPASACVDSSRRPVSARQPRLSNGAPSASRRDTTKAPLSASERKRCSAAANPAVAPPRAASASATPCPNRPLPQQGSGEPRFSPGGLVQLLPSGGEDHGQEQPTVQDSARKRHHLEHGAAERRLKHRRRDTDHDRVAAARRRAKARLSVAAPSLPLPPRLRHDRNTASRQPPRSDGKRAARAVGFTEHARGAGTGPIRHPTASRHRRCLPPQGGPIAGLGRVDGRKGPGPHGPSTGTTTATPAGRCGQRSEAVHLRAPRGDQGDQPGPEARRRPPLAGHPGGGKESGRQRWRD